MRSCRELRQNGENGVRYCREQGQNTVNTAKYCREQRWTAENRVIEALQRTGRQYREHDEILQRTES